MKTSKDSIIIRAAVVVWVVLMAIPLGSHAAGIYIDICQDPDYGSKLTYPDNHQTTPVDRYWNVVGVKAAQLDVAVPLVDASNNVTAASMVLTGAFFQELGDGRGVTESTLVDWGNPVTDDNGYLYEPNTNASVRFEGLEAGARYSMTFYGGRGGNFTPDRIVSVTIDVNGDAAGGSTTQSYNSDYEGMVRFPSVVADGNGQIVVDFEAPNRGYVNGISIEHCVALSRAYIDICQDPDYGSKLTYPDNHQTTPVDRYWNVVGVKAAQLDVAVPLVDASNNVTAASMVLTGAFFQELGDGRGVTESTLVDWGNPVTDDNGYLYEPNTNASVRFEGLEAGECYVMTFYGGRGFDFTPDRIVSVTIDVNGDAAGGSTTQSYNSDYEGMVRFPSVVADGNGQIVVDFEAPNRGYVNGISIEHRVALSRAYIDICQDPDYGSKLTYPDNHQTTPVDRYWNVVGVKAAQLDVAVPLVDASNNVTAASMVLTDAFLQELGDGRGVTDSALVDWGDEVTGDNGYIGAPASPPVDTNGAVRFEGLEAGARYSMTFYGGRGGNYTPARIMSVTIDVNGDAAGGSTTQTYNSNNEGLVTFSSVVADGNGQIVVDFDAPDGGHLSGISINLLPPPKGTVLLFR